MITVKIREATKQQLIELAGSPRKVGQYLDELVPLLHEAQAELDSAVEQAQRDVLLAALAKRKQG